MNGLSFADFERSSLDELYTRNFAGARDAEKLCHEAKEGLSRGLPNLAAPFKLAESAFSNHNAPYRGNSRAVEPVGYAQTYSDTRPAPVPRRESEPSAARRPNAKAISTKPANDYYAEKRNSQQSVRNKRSEEEEEDDVDRGELTKKGHSSPSRPLNDFGRALPGNARVSHEWKPSKEANERAMNDFTGHCPTSSGAGKGASAPQKAIGGAEGNYLRWQSN